MFKLSFLKAYRRLRPALRAGTAERTNIQAALLPFAVR